ncbi:FAD-dependent pyridine nucleotide-disulfide oxidoreductase [Candidatus Vecturithrix granuli]|uniref:FAD-dependent pyridine nucleotide-disulfide oxidoreductase n=1 Tax=Vecturithrix granuli TaxID=1499967 RepID=A0A0S6WAY9_VECG1|nr:FAD-dependent pyridine nucleotide-disulfide oxidoreductase [Candidatus Vecturithrix granuli]
MKKMECDVAVIGSGPGGLAAAIAASDHGAEKVLLIERDESLGGILQQCIHNGFGLHLLHEDLTGPEYAERFIAEVYKRPIECLLQTMVIELTSKRQITAISRKEGILQICPRAVVLAMGCRERTRGAISLPGSRPAGIMTAGTAQRFINIEGYLPGKEIVILGSGDIGMIMARRLHLEGCHVKAVVELNNCIGGLSRNLVQCLHDFDIPLYLNHTITDIKGHKRVEEVAITPLDKDGQLNRSKTFSMTCDTLLLSVGLIPENELSKQADILIDPHTGGPVVDQCYQTSIEGIFAAGNVVQVFDLVDHVSICGAKAGESAARFALGKMTGWGNKIRHIAPGNGIRCVIPQKLSDPHGEEIHFYLRSNEVTRKATLQLLNNDREPVFTEQFRIVRPPEMLHVAVGERNFTSSGQYTFCLTGENEVVVK